MTTISANDNNIVSSSSASLSDDDISLPPELLERERQLMEKNKMLEQRVKNLLKQTLDSEELGPQSIQGKKLNQKKIKSTKPLPNNDYLSTDDISVPNIRKSDNIENDSFSNSLSPDDEPSPLPKARQSPTNKNIIEVEVPSNVFAIPEIRVDPVPELREAFHKIAEEIQGVTAQIAEVESNKSKCEVVISKLQTELKKVQIENDRAVQEGKEFTAQIESNKKKLSQLKTQINAARLTKIDRVQRQNEAKAKIAALEKKIKRQKIIAERLQSEINSMQTPEMRAAKISSDRAKCQQQMDQEKKALRQLKLLMSDIQRAASHEEKIFDHLQSAKNISLTSETVERALTQLL